MNTETLESKEVVEITREEQTLGVLELVVDDLDLVSGGIFGCYY